MRYLTSIAAFIDRISEWSGRTISWLVLAMVLIVCYDVIMRFVFLQGSVALQELEWHLFALIFLIGSAYTFKHEGHVCVDILSHSRWMTPVRSAWVQVIGGLFFLLPFCLLITISSFDFVETSYRFAEKSPDPGGLAYRYLLKAVIPLAFILLLLQGLVSIFRNLLIVLGKEEIRR